MGLYKTRILSSYYAFSELPFLGEKNKKKTQQNPEKNTHNRAAAL